MNDVQIMHCGTKELKFTVLGNAHGQERPMFIKAAGRAFDRKNSVTSKAYIRAMATTEMLAKGFTLMHKDMPVEMRVISYRRIPDGKPVYYKKAAELGLVAPLVKPDATNVVKEIEDALNGVAYEDDKQIFKSSYEARYGDIPRTEITLIGYFTNIGDIKDEIARRKKAEETK